MNERRSVLETIILIIVISMMTLSLLDYLALALPPADATPRPPMLRWGY
jgi:hypothetical protein